MNVQANTEPSPRTASSAISLTDLHAWAAEYGLTPAELWEMSFYGKFPGDASARDMAYLIATCAKIRPEKILN